MLVQVPVDIYPAKFTITTFVNINIELEFRLFLPLEALLFPNKDEEFISENIIYKSNQTQIFIILAELRRSVKRVAVPYSVA